MTTNIAFFWCHDLTSVEYQSVWNRSICCAMNGTHPWDKTDTGRVCTTWTPRHLMYCYRSVTQIPQCTGPTSINAPFCDRNVCTFLITKCCIVGYLSNALWDLWDESIGSSSVLTQCRSLYWHSYNHCRDSNSHRINRLRPRQDGRHFPDDIFKWISWMKMLEFRLRNNWNLFLRFKLTISQHWFR